MNRRAFTLVELIIVLAVVALAFTLIVKRHHEIVSKQNASPEPPERFERHNEQGYMWVITDTRTGIEYLEVHYDHGIAIVKLETPKREETK